MDKGDQDGDGRSLSRGSYNSHREKDQLSLLINSKRQVLKKMYEEGYVLYDYEFVKISQELDLLICAFLADSCQRLKKGNSKDP